MNLLITGAAGFIGSHFVLRHIKAHPNDKIVVIDKFTYAANKSFLDPVFGDITLVEGDIADQKLVMKLVQEHTIEMIINFAAESHVDNSIKDASPFIHTNVLGVQSLIEVCRSNPSTRLFQISTDEVYGDIGDDDQPRNVDDALFPSSPYAASKAAGEMLIMAAMRTYGIKACISRCTNNYGPHQASEKFIPIVIHHALRDESVPIYAEGKNKRDWLFVSDHCDAIEVILKTEWAFDDNKSGHLFNISADEEKENIEVAKAILDILGKPHSLITFTEDRPGHDWRYALNSFATQGLGWSPKITFAEGLKQTVEWYCGNAKIFSDIHKSQIQQ